MATYFGARDALPPPRHPDQGLSPSGSSAALNQERTVTLRHPRYPDDSNVLLVLLALDPCRRPGLVDDDSAVEFGLHHDTARVACAIIANCRWDGFLSEDAEGAKPVTAGLDDALPGSDYYFQVPRRLDDGEDDVPYPIVPSFAHFRFPHNNLPPTWTAPTLSFPASSTQTGKSALDIIINARDLSCRLTASTIGTEIAHFIPRTEEAWFVTNQMSRYSSRPEPTVSNKTNNARNAILLTSNLHSAYDQRQLVLVPKWGVWVAHVLFGPPGGEVAAVYHNVAPQPLTGLAVQYVFARFAWTVFAQTSFVDAGMPRRVVIRGKDGVPTTQEVSGPECRTMFAPVPARSKSRSESPKKRVRDDTADEDDDYHNNDEPDYADLDDPVWDTRGRPRKRRAYLSEASRFGYWHNASDREVQAGYA